MIDILDVLRSQNLVCETTLSLIRRYMSFWGVPASDALLECHVLNQKQLASAIATYMNASRFVTVSVEEIEKADGFKHLRYEKAIELKAILVSPIGESSKYLVVADPSISGLTEFVDTLPFTCSLAIAEKRHIAKWISDYYPIEEQLPSFFQHLKK
jgi:hypothetical protein